MPDTTHINRRSPISKRDLLTTNSRVIECFARCCLQRAHGDPAQAVALAREGARGNALHLTLAAIGTELLRGSAN